MEERRAIRYVLDDAPRRVESKAHDESPEALMEQKREKKRGPAVIFLIPLIVAFAASSRAGHNMRTVDFLTVFGAGMLVGVSLMGLIQTARKSKSPAA
jgi:hypothetical protein